MKRQFLQKFLIGNKHFKNNWMLGLVGYVWIFAQEQITLAKLDNCLRGARGCGARVRKGTALPCWALRRLQAVLPSQGESSEEEAGNQRQVLVMSSVNCRHRMGVL